MQVGVHQICHDVYVLKVLVVRKQDDVLDDDEVLVPPEMSQQFQLAQQSVVCMCVCVCVHV